MKKDVPLCINFLTKKTPYKGLGAESEEKHEPVSDVDTAVVESLKALDPDRPIREADIDQNGGVGNRAKRNSLPRWKRRDLTHSDKRRPNFAAVRLSEHLTRRR